VDIFGHSVPAPALFYGLQSASMVFLWLFVWSSGGGDFYRHALECTVALRPTWLPKRCLLLLHRRAIYLLTCYSVPPLLALAALFPGSRALRCLVALAASLYQLAESSVTMSHRDYLMLYNTWGLALLPDAYAAGLALGLCVHFIVSSGLAKLYIGGAEWVRPETMRSIMRTYGRLSFSEGGPWSPKLNRLVSDHDSLAWADSLGTLFFECVAVPLAFAVPVGARLTLGVTMLLMHVGIFAVQSAVIGVFFVPNVASYTLGFGADLPWGSPGWWVALAVCLASVGLVATRMRLLPEDWPLTPLALFGWSGRQWNTLFARFVSGRTRLVLSAEQECEPLGRPVVERMMRSSTSPKAAAVYSAWDLCLGETTVQNDILEALDFGAMEQDGWCAAAFVQSVEAWLVRSQRLLELGSGRPLVRAFFVELAEDGTVSRVLAEGTPAERRPLLAGARA